MRVVVGVGANLGDRARGIRAAIASLAAIARIERASSIYETSPQGGPPQPDYLNAAVLLHWDKALPLLLDATQSIEASLGRVRRVRWAARTIDLDILWAEGMVSDDPRLTVPHPRLTERAFALVPLLEVCPGCLDPRTGQRFVSPTSPTLAIFYEGPRG